MSSNRDRLPIVEGAVTGIVAWIVGYVITYVVVAPDVRESPLNRIIEAVDGEPATYEMVGWVFYNAHLVNTVFRDIPVLGGFTTNFIGGEDGFITLLYLIPVVLLLLSGVGIARYHGATDMDTGVRAGLTVVPGYLLLSIAGVFLFQVTIGQASGAPDLLPGLFLAGIAYPVIVGGAGGVVGGLLGGRDRRASTPEQGDRPD